MPRCGAGVCPGRVWPATMGLAHSRRQAMTTEMGFNSVSFAYGDLCATGQRERRWFVLKSETGIGQKEDNGQKDDGPKSKKGRCGRRDSNPRLRRDRCLKPTP